MDMDHCNQLGSSIAVIRVDGRGGRWRSSGAHLYLTYTYVM